MIKVTIDRREWLRGEGGCVSYLYRLSDARMCCLGFACLAAGISKESIADETEPRDIPEEDKLPRAMFTGVDLSDNTNEAMLINDNRHLDEWNREAKLKELAPKMGFEFEFVN